jgi:hypothetical protein
MRVPAFIDPVIGNPAKGVERARCLANLRRKDQGRRMKAL